jgi:hypothetical protein
MRRAVLIFLCLCTAAIATQLSFNSGQQSQLMKYRVDVDNHSMAAEELNNIIVKPEGRASKRPGSEYVDDSNSTDTVRLVPFEYSTDDAYVLEFGHKYIGFFRTTQ